MNHDRTEYQMPVLAMAWGYILQCINIQINGRKLLFLTFAGVLLLCWSFCQMRNVSREFENVWLLVCILLVYHILRFIYMASNAGYGTGVYMMDMLASVVGIAILLSFRRALISYRQEWETLGKGDPLLWLTFYYAVSLAVSILIIPITVPGLKSGVLREVPFYAVREILPAAALLVLVIQIKCVVRFYKMGKWINRMEPAGIPPRERWKSGRFTKRYAIVSVVSVLLASLISSRPVMDFQEVPLDFFDKSDKLEASGFSEYMQRDFSYDHCRKFEKADHTQTDSRELPFGSNGYMMSNIMYLEYSNDELYIVEYFSWEDGVPVTNCRIAAENNKNMEFVEGRLMCRKNGQSLFSQFEEMEKKENTEIDHEINIGYKAFAEDISYPFNSSERRGYLIFRCPLSEGEEGIDTGFSFVHHALPYIQIPYRSAGEEMFGYPRNVRRHYAVYEPYGSR